MTPPTLKQSKPAGHLRDNVQISLISFDLPYRSFSILQYLEPRRVAFVNPSCAKESTLEFGMDVRGGGLQDWNEELEADGERDSDGYFWKVG